MHMTLHKKGTEPITLSFDDEDTRVACYIVVKHVDHACLSDADREDEGASEIFMALHEWLRTGEES